MVENISDNEKSGQMDSASSIEQEMQSIEAEVAAAQAELDAARAKLEAMKAEQKQPAEEVSSAVVIDGIIVDAIPAAQPTAEHTTAGNQGAQTNGSVPPPPSQQEYYWQQPSTQEQAYYTPPQDQQGYQTTQQQTYQPMVASKDHVAAGLLAIFLGGLGIHKFYLGYNTSGFIMLAITILGGLITFSFASWVMWIIAIIEGIMYLTKSQQEFEQTYVFNKREWF